MTHADYHPPDPKAEKAYMEYQSGESPAGSTARLMFQSNANEPWQDLLDTDAVGTLEGTVRVGGNKVGEVGVYPSDSDPVSTDYVRFSLDDWDPDTYEVTVDGVEAGDFVVEPREEMERGDYLPGGDEATDAEDDAPESDPADLPGMVNDGDGGAEVAPGLIDAGVPSLDDLIGSDSSGSSSTGAASTGTSSSSSTSATLARLAPLALVAAAALGWWLL